MHAGTTPRVSESRVGVKPRVHFPSVFLGAANTVGLGWGGGGVSHVTTTGFGPLCALLT